MTTSRANLEPHLHCASPHPVLFAVKRRSFPARAFEADVTRSNALLAEPSPCIARNVEEQVNAYTHEIAEAWPVIHDHLAHGRQGAPAPA